ncbi:MAG: MmgE/PrpD family protein [Anaerolineales bacterium]|nr:MAG: MmgE/PrpD family protein [Anaerolineales bacterium]
MNGNDVVSSFITHIAWEKLPPAVQRKVRMALLDTLGAAVAGTLTPVSRIAADYAVETWPSDEATILRHGQRALAVGAAFANGYAANGLDIDDCALYTRGHPGAQIFPTALGLAESLGLGGAEMLTSMVVGYEVAHRVARIWHATHEVYQACGSWGSVTCAAVAAHLMRLTPEQTWHALGIAEYHAPNLPMMRDIDHPAMVKHGIGWGAMTGITAAQLAARGFTGIPSLLNFGEYRDCVSDIGQHYIMVDGIAWKKYACCAWVHAALKGAEGLAKARSIRAEEIAHIRVEAPYDTVRLGTELPITTEEAQFSVAWPLAALVVDGEVGPDQMLEHRFGDQRIRDLAEKIELVETDELNELYRLAASGDPRGKYASVMIISLNDGKTFNSGIVTGDINYPQQDWDEHRVEEKFRWLTRPVLDKACVNEVVEMPRHFEEVPKVRELTQMLA